MTPRPRRVVSLSLSPFRYLSSVVRELRRAVLESAPLDEFLLLSEHLRRIAERAEAAGATRRPVSIEEMEMLAALTAEYGARGRRGFRGWR